MKGFIILHNKYSDCQGGNLILLNIANIEYIKEDGTIGLSSGQYYNSRESYEKIVSKIKEAMEE